MDEQIYQIVLSPDLGIPPEEFARAWNEMAQARAIAEARLVESKGTHFDPTLVAGILRCIDYSYSNLSPEGQTLLLCLAPFTSVIFRILCPWGTPLTNR